jgi:hypothetical protein
MPISMQYHISELSIQLIFSHHQNKLSDRHRTTHWTTTSFTYTYFNDHTQTNIQQICNRQTVLTTVWLSTSSLLIILIFPYLNIIINVKPTTVVNFAAPNHISSPFKDFQSTIQCKLGKTVKQLFENKKNRRRTVREDQTDGRRAHQQRVGGEEI